MDSIPQVPKHRPRSSPNNSEAPTDSSSLETPKLPSHRPLSKGPSVPSSRPNVEKHDVSVPEIPSTRPKALTVSTGIESDDSNLKGRTEQGELDSNFGGQIEEKVTVEEVTNDIPKFPANRPSHKAKAEDDSTLENQNAAEIAEIAQIAGVPEIADIPEVSEADKQEATPISEILTTAKDVEEQKTEPVEPNDNHISPQAPSEEEVDQPKEASPEKAVEQVDEGKLKQVTETTEEPIPVVTPAEEIPLPSSDSISEALERPIEAAVSCKTTPSFTSNEPKLKRSSTDALQYDSVNGRDRKDRTEETDVHEKSKPEVLLTKQSTIDINEVKSKKPPPRVPKKPSSRIAQFQQMLQQQQKQDLGLLGKRSSPKIPSHRPKRASSEEESEKGTDSSYSSFEHTFPKGVSGIPLPGIALPGMAFGASSPFTMAHADVKEDVGSSTVSDHRRGRARGPRGRKLPGGVQKTISVNDETLGMNKFDIFVEDSWRFTFLRPQKAEESEKADTEGGGEVEEEDIQEAGGEAGADVSNSEIDFKEEAGEENYIDADRADSVPVDVIPAEIIPKEGGSDNEVGNSEVEGENAAEVQVPIPENIEEKEQTKAEDNNVGVKDSEHELVKPSMSISSESTKTGNESELTSSTSTADKDPLGKPEDDIID
ncbi:DEKNAAC104569 [Brettanomyces naardenensis]|uniref:DEKNAAC104570 n=1 Tax=Brettanomyces naardenensis TaxID=13370 RepID=A0A448YR90_BRENA|nr:DEKNAAC104569 [Brettanomyces naardenensis]